MGIDGMRVGGGRCPPLIVAGLIVACFLLVCNWWSLSTENIELLRQIDSLSQQLKSSVQEKDECGMLRADIQQKYKKLDDDLTDVRMQLGHSKNSEHRLDEELKMSNTELERLRDLDETRNETMELMRKEKETLNQRLETRKKENKKLQEDLDRVQDELERLKIVKNVDANDKPTEDGPPAGGESVLTNETVNGGNQEEQNDLDAGNNRAHLEDLEVDNNPEIPEVLEDNAELEEDNRQIATPEVKQDGP